MTFFIFHPYPPKTPIKSHARSRNYIGWGLKRDQINKKTYHTQLIIYSKHMLFFFTLAVCNLLYRLSLIAACKPAYSLSYLGSNLLGVLENI